MYQLKWIALAVGLTDFNPFASHKAEQILDVRSDDEWNDDHDAHAGHIPLQALRERLDGLDHERSTVVVFRSGRRAYIASRILEQKGFGDVSLQARGGVARPPQLC